jgi:hypothetical protein
VTPEFLVGVWKYTDEFQKWGVTDKDRAAIRPYTGVSYMALREDGEVKMLNLFKPDDARWEWTPEGIALYSPRFPDSSRRVLSVRKRGKNKIWVLLPFTQGATGIGMVRATEEELKAAEQGADQRKPVKSDPPPARRGEPKYMQPGYPPVGFTYPVNPPSERWMKQDQVETQRGGAEGSEGRRRFLE